MVVGIIGVRVVGMKEKWWVVELGVVREGVVGDGGKIMVREEVVDIEEEGEELIFLIINFLVNTD